MDKQHATPYQQQLVAMRAALLAQMAAQRGGDIGRVEAASAHFSHSEESPAQMATEKEIEFAIGDHEVAELTACLLYTSPSPRDRTRSRMPSSA